MSITDRFTITLSPLRLHSASSVRIPYSINNFRTMLRSILVRPINLFSAAFVNFCGAGNTNMIKNNLRIRLSPLKSPILRTIPIRLKEVVCILVFLSAMLRGAGAVLINALRLPFLYL